MNSVHKWPVSGGATGTATEAAVDVCPAGVHSVGEWVLVILVLGNLAWTAMCLGGFRPETMVVASAVNAATFALWLAMSVWRRGRFELRGAALATLPFLVYGAVSAGWLTPVPWMGWQDWLRWAQMAAVFWVVLHGIRSARAQEVLFVGLAALGVVAVCMAVYQRVSDPAWLMMGRSQSPQFFGRSSGFFGIPNSLAALLNMLLPPMVALALQRGAGAMQRVICGYLAALFAAGVLLTVSRGAWLSLGLVLAAWPLLAFRDTARRWRWSLSVAVLLVGIAALLYLGVPAARARIDSLVQHQGERSRAVLWRAGWGLVREKPLLGTGAGSYGVLFERHRPGHFGDDPRWAHNDYLNTLSDYGLLGFLLSFGAAALFLGQLRSAIQAEHGSASAGGTVGRMRAIRSGLAIGLLAFALQLLVDFNLKIPALAQIAAVAAALVISQSEAGQSRRPVGFVRVPWFAGAIVALLVVVAIPLRLIPLCRAEALRYGAREEMEHLVRHPAADGDGVRVLGAVRVRLGAAVQLDPRNGQAWADLADAIVFEAQFDRTKSAALGKEAEIAATQALDCSQAVPEFWVWRAQAFDLQGRWRDGWADFVRAIALAPKRSDLWCYYAYHLSFRDLDSARAALATCLELDPWNAAALTLQKHLDNNRS
jgi:O-antigen ligase